MLPELALSVRQPWAWAILHAGKDIENRTQFAITKGDMRPAAIAIHAGKVMTRADYLEGYETMLGFGIVCPPPATLARGAIVGQVRVTAIVKQHASRWFFGPRGLVLAEARALEAPIAAVGELGFFRWKPAAAEIMPPPARWMTPRPRAADLFG